MTNVVWDHGAWGYNVRISSRETELTLKSDRPVASLDVELNNGPSIQTDPRAWEQPRLTDAEAGAHAAGFHYHWSPIVVKIHVYFEDEGDMHALYLVDSCGRISSLDRMGRGAPNHAKGLGKGITRLP